jgi:hypothetical protein
MALFTLCCMCGCVPACVLIHKVFLLLIYFFNCIHYSANLLFFFSVVCVTLTVCAHVRRHWLTEWQWMHVAIIKGNSLFLFLSFCVLAAYCSACKNKQKVAVYKTISLLTPQGLFFFCEKIVTSIDKLYKIICDQCLCGIICRLYIASLLSLHSLLFLHSLSQSANSEVGNQLTFMSVYTKYDSKCT